MLAYTLANIWPMDTSECTAMAHPAPVHKSMTGAVPQMAAARALADAPLGMDSV